ncbi:uncharacterized protein [Excalfactoria chinensis]|uniref:uncharacterized protein n=1 Tax=Excalfactoria chinensis TaxID=46218 RepID=UPI003B3AB5B4
MSRGSRGLLPSSTGICPALGSSWHPGFPPQNTQYPRPPPCTYTHRKEPGLTHPQRTQTVQGAEPEPLASSGARTARQPQEMCRGRRCWGLGSLLLLLLGQNLGLHIEIPQDAVSGTVGQSVLLPVSYRVNSSLPFPLAIEWKFGNSSQVIITCTVQNCSLDAWGAPKKCSALSLPHTPYRGRIEVFPENASLLLRDLRLSDSGVYSIVFKQQKQSRRITLAVHKQRVVSVPPDEDTKDQDNPHYYTVGVCSLIGLLLLFLVPCIWWRGAVWKKRRTITQQQASNTEDTHVENPVVRDMATIYVTVGEDFEETKPRALPETLYASIDLPQLPSALAPNFAGDRCAAKPR